MKMKAMIPAALLATTLIGCADFSESFENVIVDKKIRPFAIRMTPAEAMPGDTVEAELLLWDAGKDYQVQWHMGLGYSIANYGSGESVKTMLDLDSMAISKESGSLKIRFVVPKGKQNPLLLSPMVAASEATINALDKAESFPNEIADSIDAIIAPLYIDAVVTSGDFKLTVQKLLTIRYSAKVEEGERVSNVNRNPHLDSLALIVVDAKDVEDPEKISRHNSDTLWFPASGDLEFAELPTHEIEFSREKSYFWMVAAEEPQDYVSPAGLVHKELLNYQWFYTNLTEVGSDWDKQIGFSFYSGNDALNITCMQLPEDENMDEFAIHIVARDNRPEWQMLNSAGIDFLQFHGKIK